MPEANARFVGSIPEIYDRYLGPVLFEAYAEDLAGRLNLSPGARVLEVACGTGILTRHLRDRLPPGASLVATDLNQPMLDYARAKLGDNPAVEWRPADASALPFGDRSFDVVACQFGIMFVPDKVAAVREARRVLKPGGTFAFSVWGSMEENPLGRIAHTTIASFFPSDPPTFYQVPFGFHDRGTIESLLREGGFGAVEVQVQDFVAESPSAGEAARGLVFGNPVLLAIQERGSASPDAIRTALSDALARAGGEHPLRLPTRALAFLAL